MRNRDQFEDTQTPQEGCLTWITILLFLTVMAILAYAF